MKNTDFKPALLCCALLLSAACSSDDNGSGNNNPPQKPAAELAVQQNRMPWYTANPETRAAAATVESECHKLEFFGWGESTDKIFTLRLPDASASFDRIILEYRMGGWNEGPGEWDNTTMLFVENKADGEWYEIARAFTPYGSGFDSSWNKTFYLDVTEYRPMLSGDTRFRLYYGGFDANASRAHTLTATFDFYGGTPVRNTVYTAKLYDSSRNGNSGYRAWCYGVAGHDIEDAERLGPRTIEIPDEVKSLQMKVSISGHGHDLGTFPDRPGYRPQNAAEFVENTYTIDIGGVEQNASGRIFYSNADNYWQAGTYRYDRANWAPGNPLYVHYWGIEPQTDAEGRMTLDLNLDRFVSTMTEPNAEGVAQYIVEVDIFGFDK